MGVYEEDQGSSEEVQALILYYFIIMEIVTREKADAIALETLRSAGVDIKSTNDFETWLQAQSVEQMRKIIKNAHRDVWNWSYVKGDAAYWEDEERARYANGKIFVLRELIRRLRDECN